LRRSKPLIGLQQLARIGLRCNRLNGLWLLAVKALLAA
jgi:hypothetical protein